MVTAPALPAAAAGPEPTFASAVDYTVQDPNDIVTADLDSDGVLDLITTDDPGSQINVLMGEGDGTFAAPTVLPAGARPKALTVGDLDADGHPDIVTASSTAETISVLMGVGDGTFESAVDYSIGGGSKPAAWVAVQLGDLNGDDIPDIVTGGTRTSAIVSLLGNGDGTFQSAVSYSVGSGAKPRSIALGDLNGDGDLDAASVGIAGSDGELSIFPGNGDGTFSGQNSLIVRTDPVDVIIDDVDGDSNLDEIVSDRASGAVGVSLGDGTLTPTSPTYFDIGPDLLGISSGRFTREGPLDIVGAVSGESHVGVLPGSGDGTFGSPLPFNTADTPQTQTVGDFNDDGNADIAVISTNLDTVSVLLNSAAPTVTSVSPDRGPTAGGTQITVRGTGFAAGSTVRVGGADASEVTVVDGRTITATTPPGTAGSADVEVVRADAASVTASGAFTYIAPDPTPTPTPTPTPPAPEPPAPPTPPLSVTYTVLPSGKTLVQWAGSVSAVSRRAHPDVGYRVRVGDRVLCVKGSQSSRCTLKRAYGKSADLSVLAYNDAGSSEPTPAKYRRSSEPVQFGAIQFPPDSAHVDSASRRELRAWARLLVKQGFDEVTLDGFTARALRGGDPAYRKALSRERAEAVRAIVAEEVNRVGATLRISIRARGGEDPVGNNGTPAGRAKNRRATIMIR